MYERIQYSTEEIREVIQTLRRIYDNAEKNLKEWTQIKALLQECSFSKENKEMRNYRLKILGGLFTTIGVGIFALASTLGGNTEITKNEDTEDEI